MTTIPATTGTTGTNAGNGVDPVTGKKKPTSLEDVDVNQFLQLMIAELTNQDPLNPMDNTQLVQQIGQLREISSNDKLISTLEGVQTGQSLSTAGGLIGKTVNALDDQGDNVTGKVDRVSIEVDEDNSSKRSYKVHIGEKKVDLKNIREVKP
jgi:flagellar basal-body rod modification protein FlgD